MSAGHLVYLRLCTAVGHLATRKNRKNITGTKPSLDEKTVVFKLIIKNDNDKKLHMNFHVTLV